MKTAVEWQFEQFFNSFEKFNNRECTFNDFLKRNLEIREQAKEIETEKRIEAFDDGFQQGVQSMIHIVLEEKEWDGVDDGREYVKVQDWSEMRTRKI